MKLNITQSTSLTEEVNTNIISKLYLLAHAGLETGSDLLGRLHSAGGYANEILWLTNTYENLYITADAEYILFEDDAVKDIVVSNWGSNGGITLDLIRLVTSIGSAFTGNTTITKFNEFSLFPATGLDHCTFAGCSNLEELTLPSTFLYCYEGFVQRCTKLKEIRFPAATYYIAEGFASQSGLERIYTDACTLTTTHWQLPTGFTHINIGSEIYKLKVLTLPEGIDALSLPGSVDPSFEMTIPASVKCIAGTLYADTDNNGGNNSSVSKITFALNSQLLYFASYSMYKNLYTETLDVDSFTATHGVYNALTTITIPCNLRSDVIENFPKDLIKVIPNQFRQNCDGATTEVADLIGSSVLIIGQSAFRSTGTLTKQVVIPASCRIIGDSAFFGCCPPSFKILATTPPVLPLNINGTTGAPGYLFAESYSNTYPKTGTKIYVPASALNAYQTTSGWSFYSSYYEAISE